jgi:hypothetical protein
MPTRIIKWKVGEAEINSRSAVGAAPAFCALLVGCLLTLTQSGLGRVDKPDPDSNGREEHEGRKALDELVVSGGDAT